MHVYVCVACECNPQGSATQQCDRRTGQCECEPGITGAKCDQCDRGTTGDLPHCEPCGECFDNWDQIITELTGLFILVCVCMCVCMYVRAVAVKSAVLNNPGQKNLGSFKEAQPTGFWGYYWVFGFFLFERAVGKIVG